MEQKAIIETHGVITIRPIKPAELKDVIKLLKKSFKIHNVFSGPTKDIRKYLAKLRKAEENNPLTFGIIVATLQEEKKDVLAGTMVVRTSAMSKEGLHASFKYMHLAVNEKYRKHGIGTKLMGYADEKIHQLIEKGKIKTARVQVNIAEPEKETINFYEKSGFHVEANLSNYYRYNEQVYILSKLISAEENKEG
ncbi:MAG: GNAT family N-acetyltransferase [Nanoarchaeota archaeon]|nr:GNAT family N-acetyltransferase [Nanoarchaeota archaeon]